MPPRSEAPRRRILVADDDPAIIELVIIRLELAGYWPFLARDGYECMATLAKVLPAALILDINMPRYDGFAVLEHMGKVGAAARVPTMVLTARNDPNDIQRALALGARDFLAKPFKDELLLSRVARLVRRIPLGAPIPPAGAILDPNALET